MSVKHTISVWSSDDASPLSPRQPSEEQDWSSADAPATCRAASDGLHLQLQYWVTPDVSGISNGRQRPSRDSLRTWGPIHQAGVFRRDHMCACGTETGCHCDCDWLWLWPTVTVTDCDCEWSVGAQTKRDLCWHLPTPAPLSCSPHWNISRFRSLSSGYEQGFKTDIGLILMTLRMDQ